MVGTKAIYMAKDKICGIYKITNTTNGKVYIGQSVDIYNRWRGHRSAASTLSAASHLPLYKAMRKYGKECFDFSIVVECLPEDLDILEQKYIKEYKSDDPDFGYNDSRRTYELPDQQTLLFVADCLKNRALSVGEISELTDISHHVISKINQGSEPYKIASEIYPLRGNEIDIILSMMHEKQCIPDINFKLDASPLAVYEEYKTECVYRNDRGEDVPILFDEYINIHLIDKILSTSLKAVAQDFGFCSGVYLSGRLRSMGLPGTIPELQTYYEEQTGHPHLACVQRQIAENNWFANRSELNRKTAWMPIAQYDLDSHELIEIYDGAVVASRLTGIDFTYIYGCCEGRNHGNGYIWRYLDRKGKPIAPAKLKEHKDNQRLCIACRREIAEGDFCNTCSSILEECPGQIESFTREDYSRALLKVNKTALSVIYECKPRFIDKHVLKTGITSEDYIQYKKAISDYFVNEFRAKAEQRLNEELQPGEYFKKQKKERPRRPPRQKLCGIYQIINNINQKCYIGQSTDIIARWRNHLWNVKNGTKTHAELYQAMSDYGSENFELIVLEECNEEELNDKKWEYIRKYKSNEIEYGYNIFHSPSASQKCPNLSQIITLLRNSGLFMTEIASLCNVNNNTVRTINEGQSYVQEELEYPIRSHSEEDVLFRMRYKQCRPSLDFRQNHTAQESYEEYKNICRQKNAEGEKIPIIFDEDIDIDFIDELLSNPLPDVAEKYGYKDVTRIQKHLKTIGLPHKIADLKIYYEQQTGRPHSSSSPESKRKKGTNPRISRPVVQYDGETREFIAVFLTQAEAARAENIKGSGIMAAVAERGRTKKCHGFLWRALDVEGHIIPPSEYSKYSNEHHFACIACGAELPDEDSQYCKDCEEIKMQVIKTSQLENKEWLLYCLARCSRAALGIIYNLSAHTVKDYEVASGLTPGEIANARAAYQQEKLDALREIVPKILPEGM